MSTKFRKLRILWCGEASFLHTGYAIYAKEILSRLYDTGKYKIAELGCYASHDNPQIHDAPWRFYPTLPVNKDEEQAYAQNQSYQFGEWRFDDVCLDFRPDVVIDIRDWWMMEYQQRAAFRRFYKWAIMPTVDSFPQQEQYMSSYMDADTVFTYSEFGKEVLEGESNGLINVSGIPSPGANFEKLKPVSNKAQHRSQYGFMDNVNIIGTVMRNQRRKLYPNLISSFREMLDNNPAISGRTFLYIHTSYPDLGWDLPYFIKKYNMGNHTLMTYKCRSCHHFFPSFYHGAQTLCDRCGSNQATLPNTSFGVTTEELCSIINWFDLYVQYSICEGFGMPQIEAAACGVPVLTVDYSAMASVAQKLHAETIQPKAFFWDSPTHSQRAIPDDKELIEKMTRFVKLPASMKSKKGMDAYMGAKKYYTWDRSSKIWEKYLDTVEPISHEETWDSKPKIHQSDENVPPTISNNEDLVKWGVNNVWGQPDKSNSYVAMRLLGDLNYGKVTGAGGGLYYNENSFIDNQSNQSDFGPQDAINKFKSMCEYSNHWESKRRDLSQSENWDNIGRPLFLYNVKEDVGTTNAAD